MNTHFHQIIAADLNDRQDLFLTTANRLGTPIQIAFLAIIMMFIN